MSVIRALVGCLLTGLAGCLGTGAPIIDAGPGDAALEQAALGHVNRDRGAEGLPPLRRDALLTRVARAHARDMAARGYVSHESPSGAGAQARHDRAGGADWRLVAENIAQCGRCAGDRDTADARRLHEGWMASAGHRANILSPGLDAFGYAAATGDDGLYAVQVFAGPGRPQGAEAGARLEPLSPEALSEAALARVNAARDEAGLAPLALSSELGAAVRAVLPRPGDPGFDVQSLGDVANAVPEAERAGLGGIATAHGACGACGADPTTADIRFFVDSWLERPALRARLLDDGATHLGFGLAANGEGRKVALAAVGSR